MSLAEYEDMPAAVSEERPQAFGFLARGARGAAARGARGVAVRGAADRGAAVRGGTAVLPGVRTGVFLARRTCSGSPGRATLPGPTLRSSSSAAAACGDCGSPPDGAASVTRVNIDFGAACSSGSSGSLPGCVVSLIGSAALPGSTPGAAAGRCSFGPGKTRITP